MDDQASASQAIPTIAALPKAEPTKSNFAAIKSAIEKAAATRERHYSAIDAFSISFEADDTKAYKDVDTFKEMATDLFGATFHAPLCITASDRQPVRRLLDLLNDILFTDRKAQGRSLLIVHYAGHALLNGCNLYFASNTLGSQTVPFNTLKEVLVNPVREFDRQMMTNTDVLIILDCCYAASATRGNVHAARSVEILAACDAHVNAASRKDAVSFTQRVSLAARLVRQDDGTINFAKVCEKMVRLGPRITPIHKVLVGTVPIIVRGLGYPADGPATRRLGPPEQLIKDLSLAKVVNAQPEAEPEGVQNVQVLCSISVAEDIDQLGLDELCKWIQDLEMKFSMTVECLFAGSSVVVACMPYHLWSRLQGIPGFDLISVVRSDNLLREVRELDKDDQI